MPHVCLNQTGNQDQKIIVLSVVGELFIQVRIFMYLSTKNKIDDICSFLKNLHITLLGGNTLPSQLQWVKVPGTINKHILHKINELILLYHI